MLPFVFRTTATWQQVLQAATSGKVTFLFFADCIITVHIYTGWPKKSKPPPIFQKNRIKNCQQD